MSKKRFCWFISAHGFGHAARSVAVMEALYRLDKNIEFLIVSEISPLFFEKNDLPITISKQKTDVGFVQKDAFFEDIPATLERLEAFYFNLNSRFHVWDSSILPWKPDVIVADICPAALDYASTRGIPSVLVENFTWNWLYEFYPEYKQAFEPIVYYMESAWNKAGIHVQIEPFCGPKLENTILIPPVSRYTSWEKQTGLIQEKLLEKLELNPSKPIVLMTMGGVAMQFHFYEELKKMDSVQFIIPGAHVENRFEDNLRILTHHSDFYHPDLVGISDAVIAKVGYSTLAEVHNAGKRLGFVPRYHFRETQPLVRFIHERMSGMEISNEELSSGVWISRTEELLALKNGKPAVANGADVLAKQVLTSFF